MVDTISKSQFKARALEYFRRVEKSGKSIVITDRGKPVLRLVPYTENPAEVLQSDRFRSVLEKLQTMYDRVVIDSPPVLVVSDSTILAVQVDATVFVVRAGRTSRDSARKAVRSLQDVSARVAGVVVNALDVKREGYYGDYYTRRYYRYGYGQDSQV